MVTTVSGFRSGLVWAFVAGLTANLLVREPLGTIPLELLIVAVAVAGGERLFGRLSWAYPVAAAFVGSIFVDAISLGVLQLVDPPLAGGLPLQRVLGAAFFNAAIAATVVLPIRALAARPGGDEKPGILSA